MVKTKKPVVEKKKIEELKDIKEDMLKIIDKLDSLDQKIVNVAFRVQRLEQRVGII